LTSIGYQAFQNTAITTITIPASVTSIGDYAFYNCNNLTTVYISSNNVLEIDIGDNVSFYGRTVTVVNTEPEQEPETEAESLGTATKEHFTSNINMNSIGYDVSSESESGLEPGLESGLEPGLI
jgi:hypothetical protein